MRYITDTEKNQIKMIVWNIFHAESIKRGYVGESNVMALTLEYDETTEYFDFFLELEKPLSANDVKGIIWDIMWCDNFEVVSPVTEGGQKFHNWHFKIHFNRRFYFRPLYLPYMPYPNTHQFVIYDDSVKRGLPIYKIAVPKDMPFQIFIDHLQYMIPNFCTVDSNFVDDQHYIHIGSLYLPPDDLMDFAPPLGYRFTKEGERFLQDAGDVKMEWKSI